jgi:uncharacterized protein (DUF433 family)
MANKTIPQREHMIQDPAILVGKPVVKGTRIPLELVLANLSLTVDDVRACLG